MASPVAVTFCGPLGEIRTFDNNQILFATANDGWITVFTKAGRDTFQVTEESATEYFGPPVPFTNRKVFVTIELYHVTMVVGRDVIFCTGCIAILPSADIAKNIGSVWRENKERCTCAHLKSTLRYAFPPSSTRRLLPGALADNNSEASVDSPLQLLNL